MEFTLTIRSDNAALVGNDGRAYPNELARIIRVCADQVAREYPSAHLFDEDGNPVGYWTMEDADLIAAAPDLLAALKNMLYAWETGIEYTDSENEIGNARAAIAKATGGAS